MTALRNKLILLLLLLATPVWGADAFQPECADWGGVTESKALYFLDAAIEPSLQSSLLDRSVESDLPTWIQLRYENSELRFENRTPGLGLPFTIYHVKAEWVYPDGRVWEEVSVSFPDSFRCESLSLFPGQMSRSIHVKRPKSQENLRLKLRAWTSFF